MKKMYIILITLFLSTQLINAGVVNEILKDGLTSLMVESKNGNLDQVKYLVEELKANLDIKAGKKASIKRKFKKNIKCSGWTALMFAIYGKHEDVYKYLIKKGADVFIGDDKHNNPYTMSYDIPGLKEFIDDSISNSNSSLEKTISLDDLNDFKNYLKTEISGEKLASLILSFVNDRDFSRAKILLSSKLIDDDASLLNFYKDKVKINYRDESGNTLLSIAVRNNDKKMLDLLLKSNANPFLQGQNGITPKELALNLKNDLSGAINVMEILFIKKNEIDGDGLSYLLLKSVREKNYKLLSMILNAKEIDFSLDDKFELNKVKINTCDENGNTPLILAVLNNDKKILDTLLKSNANPFISNFEGKTPKDIALSLGDKFKNIVGSLNVMETVFVNKNDISGHDLSYLLLQAARKNDYILLLAILNSKKEIDNSFDDKFELNKIKVNIVDENGNTPLIFAVLNNNKKMVQVLLEKGANPVLKRSNDGLDAYGVAIINNYSDIANFINEYVDNTKR